MKVTTTNRNLLLVSYFSNTFGFSLFVPLYAAFIVQYGQTPEKASFLWSIYTLFFALMVIVIGKIQDKGARSSQRHMLVAGYLLRLVATALFVYSLDNFNMFVAGLMIYGLGSALLTPSWFGIFVRQAKQHTSLNFSLSEGGSAIFGAAGAATGGVLFGLGGYDFIFYGMALMHCIGLISASLVKG